MRKRAEGLETTNSSPAISGESIISISSWPDGSADVSSGRVFSAHFCPKFSWRQGAFGWSPSGNPGSQSQPPPDLDLDEDTAQTRTVSPRLVVSNNDCTVKFFDVCMARKGLRRSNLQRPQDRIIDTRYWRQDPGFRGSCEGEGWGEKGMERIVRYERVGCLRLPVPVNHSESFREI